MTSTIFSADSWKEFTITFRLALKKVRGMMALLSLLLFIVFPMVFMVAMWNLQSNPQEVFTQETLDSACFSYISFIMIFLMPLILIFTVVVAVMLFSYLHRKRSVDLFHSLPIRRTPMLLGRYCAGLTALFVPAILNFMLVSVIEFSYHVSMQYSFYFVFNRMLWTLLMTAAALTFSVFMAVCSGTSFDMVLSIIGVNAAYPLLIFVSDMLESSILPGLRVTATLESTVLTAFSPFAAAFLPLCASYRENWNPADGVSTGFYIWWILCTLLLLGASILLCRRRKSECAESNFAFPIPKIIIRFMATAVAGIGFGLMLMFATGMQVSFFIGVVSGSLAAHIVTEALYSRGFQHMRKSFSWYGVFAAAFVVFYAVLATGFFGYDTRIPNAAEVQSVSMDDSNNHDNYFYSTSESEHFRKIGELSPVIQERKNIEKVLAAHRAFVEHNRKTRFPYAMQAREHGSFTLTYHLKNGGVVVRSYPCFSAPYEKNTVQTPLDDMVKQVTQIQEYQETANILFYLEPEYFKSVSISTAAKDDKSRAETAPLILNRNEKKELLEALRQDCLNGAVDYKYNPYRNEMNYLQVSFHYADSITLKDGRLKTLLGGYSGKINIAGISNFDLSSNATNTRAVIDKYGWDKQTSVAK
ncbi:MAG: ABC transporter permease [Eubacteriales bacterium]|jgi:ABC-2 type transport system permease protein